MADTTRQIIGAACTAADLKTKRSYLYIDDGGKYWSYKAPEAVAVPFAFVPADGLGLPDLRTAPFVPRKTVHTLNGDRLSMVFHSTQDASWTGITQITVDGVKYVSTWQVNERPSQAAAPPVVVTPAAMPASTAADPSLKPKRFTYRDNAGVLWSFRQPSILADQLGTLRLDADLPPLGAGGFRPRQIRYVAQDGSLRFLVTVWSDQSMAWIHPPTLGYQGKLCDAYEWLDESPDQSDVTAGRSLAPAVVP